MRQICCNKAKEKSIKIKTLTSLCEKFVVKISRLEERHCMRGHLPSFTHMLDLGVHSRCRTRPYITEITKNTDETKDKWRTRLNIVSQRKGAQESRKKMFDDHGTLFNLSFRCVVTNLLKQEDCVENKLYEREAVLTEGSFFEYIRNAEIPHSIKMELQEWHCVKIMDGRFEDYYWQTMHAEYESNASKDDKDDWYYHLARLLRFWERYYRHCQGFKLRVIQTDEELSKSHMASDRRLI